MENLAIVILLLLIIAILYFYTKRTNQTLHDLPNQLDAEKISNQRDELLVKLAKAEQRAESLQSEKAQVIALLQDENSALKNALRESQDNLGSAERSVESMHAYLEAQKDKLNEQKQEIYEIKQQLNKDFELIAGRILEEKSKKFNEINNRSLVDILRPLGDNLKAFEEKVEKTYHHEAAERNSLKGVVMQLMEQSKQIQDDANNLTKALKGDQKQQGNWGEVILERVLERSGLVKNREYRIQVSLNTEQGNRLQPDAVIDLPDNKHLIIDSKVSLVAYERWVNTEDDQDRRLFEKQHIQSLKNHVNDLSKKNYQELYGINSPDFVLLFVPIESAFSMSVSYENDVFSDAWDKRVVMVSPSTLLATLRTIASIWKQERQNRNVQEIAREAGALYDKFVGFTEDMDKIEKQILILLRTHEDARKKLEHGKGNVISKVEKLKRLGARTTKQLETPFLEPESEEN